jgi:ferredoxin-NADP reductase
MNPSNTGLTPVRQAARRFFSASWLHPLNDSAAVDDFLAGIDPLWSLNEVRARVAEVILETPDTRTFVLVPNRHWNGHRAGQYLSVQVEIDGVRHHRSYSVSAAPGGERIAITVKRQPGGMVSNWLHDHVRQGDTLRLSAAAGVFVLPETVPDKLLMISAGSGITPLMSMLRGLHAAGYAGEILFLHCARSREQTIFGGELQQLAAAWPALRLINHYTADAGRLDAAGLLRHVPRLQDWQTLLCGPTEFMELVRGVWRERGLLERLSQESFTGALPRDEATSGTESEVRCLRSEKIFTAAGGALLAEAETAGLKPKHGCRMGICRSCQCRKVSGTVENLLTGEVSSAPDQTIQLCISAARSDLALDI